MLLKSDISQHCGDKNGDISIKFNVTIHAFNSTQFLNNYAKSMNIYQRIHILIEPSARSPYWIEWLAPATGSYLCYARGYFSYLSQLCKTHLGSL